MPRRWRVAVGASAVVPWLAVEMAAELAGGRGAEDVTIESAITNLLTALDAGLRKVLARMGISTAASYVGSALFEVMELHPDVVARCFPAAPAWPGRVTFDVIARAPARPPRIGRRRRRRARALPRPRLRALPGRR